MTTLPKTKEAFTLEKYKEDLRKTYARISLFLCPLKDALDSEPKQTCCPWLDLAFESDEWLGDGDSADTFTVEISQHSSATTSTTTVCATASRSFISTNSTGAVECSFSGKSCYVFHVNIIISILLCKLLCTSYLKSPDPLFGH